MVQLHLADQLPVPQQPRQEPQVDLASAAAIGIAAAMATLGLRGPYAACPSFGPRRPGETARNRWFREDSRVFFFFFSWLFNGFFDAFRWF